MNLTPENSILLTSRPEWSALPERDGQNPPARPELFLQAARRVDWRFLLPNPTLGQVAYIGQPEGTLLAALEQFSTTVQVLEPATTKMALTTGHWRESSTRYDVVVACDPTVWALEQAVTMVRPGGSLYVEIHGPLSSIKQSLRTGCWEWRQPRLGRPCDYVRTIRQLGLQEVDCYWFHPSFEACTKIIPLWEKRALLYALVRGQGGDNVHMRLQTQLRRWSVQLLARTGALELILPCFAIVAR